MNKKQVQKRVLQNGKPLALSKFAWCEKTRTLSTRESNLVIDFIGIAYCTFKTGSRCTFKTGSSCTFNTRSHCTFDTWSSCTFNTGLDCVIVNRNVFEVITPKGGDVIQIAPYGVEGHLVNGMYKGEPHIIADGILSKIIKQKGDVYKVANHGETKVTYLIKQGDIYSHGDTLQEARESLVYKLSDRDTSKYDDYTLDTKVTKNEAIQMYMAITGACEGGTRYFVENNADKIKDEFTIAEIVELTQGQYNHEMFKEFFK